jgi:type IV pilus assembly protein PilF
MIPRSPTTTPCSCASPRTEEGVKYFLEAAKNPLYRTPEAAYTNIGVCLRAAHRDDEAKQYLLKALTIKPNFGEAAYQLADLEFERGHLNDARAAITHYTDSFEATPDLLLLGVRIARAMGDRVAAEHYARRCAWISRPRIRRARSPISTHNPGS